MAGTLDSGKAQWTVEIVAPENIHSGGEGRRDELAWDGRGEQRRHHQCRQGHQYLQAWHWQGLVKDGDAKFAACGSNRASAGLYTV